MKLLMTAAALVGASATAPIVKTSQQAIPGQYMVQLEAGVSLSSVLPSIRSASNAVLRTFTIGKFNAVAVEMSEHQLATVSELPNVEIISPNYLIRAFDVEESFPACSERREPTSWGLARVSSGNLQEHVLAAKGGEGVNAYIIDTGIKCSHWDFEECTNIFCGSGLFGEWCEPADEWEDIDGQGHGTHVASTVAGQSFGVAPGARLFGLKALSDLGTGNLFSIVGGIDAAAEHAQESGRPGVANMSFGAATNPLLNAAVNNAVETGLACAVAAGNSGRDNGACLNSPASADLAFTVAASTLNDTMAVFSDQGECTQIVSPGQDITGAWIGERTGGDGEDFDVRTISGTSMATPHVCGGMALLRSSYPSDSVEEMQRKLLDVADKDAISEGIVDATPNVLLRTCA